MMQRLWLASVALAAAAVSVLALVLRRLLMRVEVAGESMTPALEPGDFDAHEQAPQGDSEDGCSGRGQRE